MTKNKEKKPKFKSMTFWMMVIILVIVMLAFIFSIVKYANERRDYSDNRFYLNPAISEDFDIWKFIDEVFKFKKPFVTKTNDSGN